MELDRNVLKIQALKEKLGQVVADYEEKLADLRADATMLVANLQAQVEELRTQLERDDEDEKKNEIDGTD